MASVLRTHNDYTDRAPVPGYSTGISDFFPRPKLRVVEGSMIDKDVFEIPSINGGTNGEVEGSFAEFRYPGHEKGYLDLSRLVLKVSGQVTKEDGKPLADTDSVSLIDGFVYGLIKSITIHLNDHQVDLNPIHCYAAYVNMVTTMNPHLSPSLGKCIGFNNEKIPSVITEAHMTKIKDEITSLRSHGFNFTTPLTCEVGGSDMYLFSNVSLRVKIEFNNDSFVLNTPTDGFHPRLKITDCRLQLTTRLPRIEAHTALLRAMRNAPLSYVYPKTLHKNYILPANQSSLNMDYPFGKIIPETMYVFMVSMDSANGNYKKNPFFFHHNNLKSLQVYKDNKNVYDVACSFPGKCSDFYFKTLDSLGLETFHGLTFDRFIDGKTIAVISLEPEKLRDVIPIEKDGNLRLSLHLSQPSTENIIVYILGSTTGVFYIDEGLNVYTDTRS